MEIKSANNFDGLQKFAEDPDKVNIIMHTDRLGTQLFCVTLEHRHYPPRTARNKLFDFHILKWPDQMPLMWFVVSIPKKDFHLAEEAAKEAGLLIKEGIPIILEASGTLEFPMKGDNCYSLESNKNSLIYKNNQEETARLKAAELVECEKILQSDEVQLREDYINKGYSTTQVDRILKRWNSGDFEYMEPPDHQEG